MFDKVDASTLTRNTLVTFDVVEHDAGDADDVAWHVVDHVDVDEDLVILGLRSMQGSRRSWTHHAASDDVVVTRDDLHNFDI